MSTLFVEVRSEELPARFTALAAEELEKRLCAAIAGLYTGKTERWATPRRIAVAVHDVIDATPEEEQLMFGPPEAAAFKDGKPTKAGEGFARSKGKDPGELQIVDGPKGRVVALRVRVGGEKTAARIAARLEEIVLGIQFPKSMRWGDGKYKWARPIHGVIALLGTELIPVSVAGIASGNTTVGNRRSPDPFAVRSAESWLAGCREHHVEPDLDARRAEIWKQCLSVAAAKGIEVREVPELLDEVTNLVEWPTVIAGTFAAELLDLPPRLLEESMRVHTRTFPTYANGALTNRFLVVHNNPFGDPATIADGNARVMTSRFYDAQFFYAEDKKKRLDEHAAGLTGMQWIRGAGTMADKATRITERARHTATALGADTQAAARAASLAKADLLTKMVREFPELQGHVGRLLAARDENATVALAIEEHYLPRFAGDALPTTREGMAVGLADRIDTLVRCFELGLAPKGSADPLGLRRAANGLVALVLAARLQMSLPALLGATPPGLVEFALARFRAQLLERWPTEVVDAVLGTGDDDLVALAARVEALGSVARGPEWSPLKTTFKRVMGLTKDHTSTEYSTQLFEHDAERALDTAFTSVRDRVRKACEQVRFDTALGELSSLKPQVDTLFDAVLVMAEDPQVRANRLGLLRAIADEFRRIADLTKLSAD
jgi:glycyl-tRNA synthetase beta chain